MSAAEQLSLEDFLARPIASEAPAENVTVDAGDPASIALEIATELKSAELEITSIAAELAGPSLCDEIQRVMEEQIRRADEDLMALRKLHAQILGCSIEDLDRVVAERDAKEKAEREAWKAQRSAAPAPCTAPSRRSKKSAEPAPAEASAPTKRLTDRQRELVGLVAVENNVARYTLEERVPDWSALKSVMLALGARWVSRKGFVFPDDVDGAETVRLALEAGEVIDWSGAGFFPTPDALADALVARLSIGPGARVFEPEAGDGQLVRAIRRKEPSAEIYACELIEANRRKLEAEKVRLLVNDFMTLSPEHVEPFHFVVQNPPFAGRADMQHIRHALRFLAPGGQLAAIASAGVLYRDDALGSDFRAEIESHGGVIEMNPEGSFASSGTMVRTVSIWLEKKR